MYLFYYVSLLVSCKNTTSMTNNITNQNGCYHVSHQIFEINNTNIHEYKFDTSYIKEVKSFITEFGSTDKQIYPKIIVLNDYIEFLCDEDDDCGDSAEIAGSLEYENFGGIKIHICDVLSFSKSPIFNKYYANIIVIFGNIENNKILQIVQSFVVNKITQKLKDGTLKDTSQWNEVVKNLIENFDVNVENFDKPIYWSRFENKINNV